MSEELVWEAPGPGPWMHDKSHLPHMVSRLAEELLPPQFSLGFGDTMARYGALLDRVQMTPVNGFCYMQPQPFDLPGPDGPKSPEWIGAEFGRRVGVAAHAFEAKIWYEDLRRWDEELKPQSVARHAELHTTDLPSLSDDELARHLEERGAHLCDMVRQHHSLNLSALVAVGDFALQVSAMAHMPPIALFAALDGASPVSGLLTPEIAPAVSAVKADPEAEATVRGTGDAATRLEELRARIPAVASWLASTEFRLVDGLDVIRPTLAECPAIALGKLAAALDADHDAANRRASAFAGSVRERLPDDQRGRFDELLADARAVSRLRDERGLYGDTSAMGLMRLGMLEAGRRLVARGVLDDPAEALEAGLGELVGLVRGASTPTAADLRARTLRRAELGVGAAPPLIGPPPPPPPPTDQLPPPMARLMSAVGFCLEGVLGQMPEATGTPSLVVGIGVGTGSYEGRARVAMDFDDLIELEQGEVLVTASTMESFNAMLHLVGALVTDHGSFASHAAIMARELGFPAVVGTVDGTHRITTGDRVRVDSTTGEVTVLP